MGLTIFGVVVILIGSGLLVAGSMSGMLVLLMVSTMFGGSAAISLGSAPGSSSVPPADLALLFVTLRAILPGEAQMATLQESIRANAFLAVFALYGILAAFVLPRLFAGLISVTPLHPNGHITFELVKLHFTMQNVTTSFYLFGTLATGICAYIAARRPGAATLIVRVGIGIAIAHATLGFVGVAVKGTALEPAIDFFRNGNYAQLDQSFDSFSRISGVWPEASAFASYGSAWFIFMFELWLRDVRPRWTGFAAALLATALIFSTSSSAYVAIAAYSIVFLLRCALLPWSLPGRKAVALGLAAILVVILAMFAMLLLPRLAGEFGTMLTQMTVGKTQTISGQQRAFMAKQGIDAFAVSYGLGIGAGSFRSSSSLAAILGSMGIVGIISFAAHVIRAFKPLRASTYLGVAAGTTAVGSAASWTALMMLAAAAVASPTPDPGLFWAMFCGFALALRNGTPAPDLFDRAISGLPIHRAPGFIAQ